MAERGLPVVSADAAARKAVEDESVKRALCDAFGDVLLPDGSLDRRKTAEVAFSSPENTAKLNAITHPKIRALMLDEAEQAAGEWVVFDASQLFESGEDTLCDLIVSVVADRKLRMERLRTRDGIGDEEIARRMSVQYDESFFRAMSDAVIENNGTVGALDRAVANICERLVSL